MAAYLDKDNILHAPDVPIALPSCSLGQFCFDSLSQLDPHKEFLVEAESGKACTLGEFFDMSIKFAQNLRGIIKEGETVCLIGLTTIDLNVIAIGTLMMGGIFAPLDSTMKPFEYEHMFDILEPAIIACDEDVIDVVEEALNKINMTVEIYVLSESSSFKEYPSIQTLMEHNISKENFNVAGCNDPSNDIAIIVPSSGSTGMPKGVALTHHNWMFEMMCAKKMAEIFKENNTLLHTSYFFWVSSVYMTLAAVGNGMKRVLMKEVNETTTLNAIEKYKPVWCILAPSLLSSIVNHPDFSTFDTRSIRCIITGGSSLPPATAEKVKNIWSPNIMLTQLYGMSELSAGFSALVLHSDLRSIGSLSYPSTSLKVIDPETKEILPPNTEGELCCKSLGLMKGYLKNEDATREAIDEEGWLHTGDIGYINDKGLIYITGRIKELMKLDNHQIAPAEIEHVIRTVPGVLDVAVAGIKISSDSSHPMALVVRADYPDVSEEEIIKCVNENLSDFKQLKAGICFVEFIPRTVTGKIKRKDLQKLADDLYLGDSPYIL